MRSPPPEPGPPGPVLALVGPTAAGKSAVALEVAPGLGAEVVSLDSTMVYRGMNIGTDKPFPDELARVPHHMVDVVECSHTLTVKEFREMARREIGDVLARGGVPLLVGGSGLYFRAVVDPLEFPPTDPEVRLDLEARAEAGDLHPLLASLDPEAARRIEPSNSRRVVRALEVIEITGRRFSSFRTAWDEHSSVYRLTVAGLTWPRPELDRRIDARVDRQIARGLVEEVRALAGAGLRRSRTAVQALGYAQALAHLDGTLSLQQAVEQTKRRTRHLARRQLTWFRADPRVVWFDADPEGAAAFLKGAA